MSKVLAHVTLPTDDTEALSDLYHRGTPANTLLAWERDLTYLTAWKAAAFNEPLAWPESDVVALRFILDHSLNLTDQTGSARVIAELLISQGLRRSLDCPAAATLDRRIASWRAFHRLRNLTSPFESPLVAQARIKARRAMARERQPRSAHPITRNVLEAMLETCDHSHRGLRDRACLMLGWASGGRKRSEIVSLNAEDIDARDYSKNGLLRVRLLVTETTGPERAPRLPLKGRAAAAVMTWMMRAGINAGPLFRPISQADRVLVRRLSVDGLRRIVLQRLEMAGYPPGFASPHGLRSGFLTQAALDGAPLAAAMQLSQHRSAAQAQRYYADVEIGIDQNPATDLLG